jgi:hypothetical protein
VRAIRPASALDDFCDLRGTHIGHIANPVSCSWVDDVDNARFIGNGVGMNADAPSPVARRRSLRLGNVVIVSPTSVRWTAHSPCSPTPLAVDQTERVPAERASTSSVDTTI